MATHTNPIVDDRIHYPALLTSLLDMGRGFLDDVVPSHRNLGFMDTYRLCYPGISQDQVWQIEVVEKDKTQSNGPLKNGVFQRFPKKWLLNSALAVRLAL